MITDPRPRRPGRPQKGEERPLQPEEEFRLQVKRQQTRFRAACGSQDFGAALEALCLCLKATGDHLKAECEAVGMNHWAGFWYEAAAEAKRAGDLYRAAGDEAEEALRAAGLEAFAQALSSGDYSALFW